MAKKSIPISYDREKQTVKYSIDCKVGMAIGIGPAGGFTMGNEDWNQDSSSVRRGKSPRLFII